MPEPVPAAGPWLPALLAAAFALKLGVVLWGLGRGFEIGDAGYFLLNLNHPEDAPGNFQFYRLLTLFDPRLHFDVLEARWLRLGVEAVASLALVAGVFAWVRARVLGPETRFVPFLLFCALGALISIGSRSVSYNDLTNLCVYVAVGCLFWLAALPAGRDGRRRRMLAALGAGLATGFQLSVKFPAALLMGLLGGLVLLGALPWLGLRERLRALGLFGAGALCACGVFVALHGGVSPLWAELAPMRGVARLSGYHPVWLLLRDASVELLVLGYVLVLALVFSATRRLTQRRCDPDTARAVALAVGAGVLALVVSAASPSFMHPTLVFLVVLLVFLVVRLGWALRGELRGEGCRALLLLLAVLPVLATLGSNVPVAMRLPSHALPVFAVLAILLALRWRAGAVRLHATACVLLVGATTALFLQHHWRAPYGLPRPLDRQHSVVRGLPVRVDAPTRIFLDAVREHMRRAGFRPGDPIVAFDYMPGLVHYLGGRSPGFTIHLSDQPALNCFNVNRTDWPRTPFLILGRPMSREQRACLEPFTFPEGFREVGVISFPYREVYASFDVDGISYVLLYAPKVEGEAGGG